MDKPKISSNSYSYKPLILQKSVSNQSMSSSSPHSSFQLDFFNVLVGIGATLLLIAIVTLPPVAALIGLTPILTAGAVGLISAATAVSGLSLLSGLGWFACSRKINDGAILKAQFSL